MTDRYEYYRRQAEYCAKLSRTSRNVELRASWLALSNKWLSLIPAAPEATGSAAIEPILNGDATQAPSAASLLDRNWVRSTK